MGGFDKCRDCYSGGLSASSFPGSWSKRALPFTPGHSYAQVEFPTPGGSDPGPKSFDIRQSIAVPTDDIEITELAVEPRRAFGGRALLDRGGKPCERVLWEAFEE